MSERGLVFRDAQGHKKAFTMTERGDYLRFGRAFMAFLRKYLSAENTTYRLEHTLTDETLIFDSATGIITRMRNGGAPETTYTRYTRYTDGDTLRMRFAHGGYSALDEHGPWTTDREGLLPDSSFVNPDLAWLRAVEKEEQRAQEVRAMPKLDRKALRTFCEIWADKSGFVEYQGKEAQHYVIYHTWGMEDTLPTREKLLKAVEKLGLELLAPSGNAYSGEVWVRADPRVDLELDKWA